MDVYIQITTGMTVFFRSLTALSVTIFILFSRNNSLYYKKDKHSADIVWILSLTVFIICWTKEALCDESVLPKS